MNYLIKSLAIPALAAFSLSNSASAETDLSMDPSKPILDSPFSKSLTPGKYILPAQDGFWNWGMAPMYDENGKLHIFNSRIPKQGGSWITKSVIQHFVADSVEGPYELVGVPFESDETTYHNPQISKVGDTYVLVFLMNDVTLKRNSQAVGIATAESLDGPWTESPLNPIIRPSRIEGSHNATHASNPTFLVDREGKFRIYYKSISDRNPGYRTIALATADKIEGPYTDFPENPLISYESFGRDIEDPYAFFYNDTYYMILEDRMDIKGALEGRLDKEEEIDAGGNRPGLLYSSKDGLDWGRPEIGYDTNTKYFGEELSRSERPHILWKDGKPEYLFLANHGSNEAGFYLKIGDFLSTGK
ncbi:glycoside hydrolase family protein [Luteolibacter sp. AS25]|uniref:glycoside hydrolase family protein n=1 Tax=Luteolibacter sp. AS25 TaxID=3135776 RepID=UPI00398ABF6C